MIRKVVVVENRLGLHARAAAKLVRLVSNLRSRILVGRDGSSHLVEGSSILALLMLAASRGTRLVFSIEGCDEDEAWQAIERIFLERFGEDS